MKIGVIGAGTMGQGIAKAFAQVEGNTVALCDIKQEWAENGLAKIKKGYEKLVAKGKMTQEKADAIVAAITPGLKEDLCADCDLVVEAAFEDMKVKQTTFGELDKICKPECRTIRIQTSFFSTIAGSSARMDYHMPKFCTPPVISPIHINSLKFISCRHDYIAVFKQHRTTNSITQHKIYHITTIHMLSTFCNRCTIRIIKKNCRVFKMFFPFTAGYIINIQCVGICNKLFFLIYNTRHRYSDSQYLIFRYCIFFYKLSGKYSKCIQIFIRIFKTLSDPYMF